MMPDYFEIYLTLCLDAREGPARAVEPSLL